MACRRTSSGPHVVWDEPEKVVSPLSQWILSGHSPVWGCFDGEGNLTQKVCIVHLEDGKMQRPYRSIQRIRRFHNSEDLRK